MSVIASLPGSLPSQPIPSHTDAPSVVKAFAPAFTNLRPEHFVDDAVWRDHLALTGSIRTFYSAASISTALAETSSLRQISPITVNPSSAQVVRHPTGPAWINCQFSFDAQSPISTSCIGFASLVPDANAEGQWKIWTLRTILQQLKGQPDADQLEPDSKVEAVDVSKTLDCVVVGAGPAGLSMAGRLKAMGLSYVCIEKNKRVGDNWKNRYESVRLHTLRNYAHLPFEKTFDPSYQEFLDADDLQRGYTEWAHKFGINIWQETELKGGTWHADSKLWQLQVQKDQSSETIRCRHIVLCIGTGGQVPSMPQFKNRAEFQGTVLHSKDYKHARDWKGKQCIVIGSANTGHDIAADMYNAGCARVTMVQRGTTWVFPVAHYKKAAEVTYNDTLPTPLADTMFLTQPHKIASLLSSAGSNWLADQIPDFFASLSSAGFRAAAHGDVIHQVYERAGGHYIDVGTSSLIAAGKIKVKSDSLADRYTRTGLGFEDGSELAADVIVFTTGFERKPGGLIRSWFGKELERELNAGAGLDEEGESRTSARPTGHPALWILGLSLGVARYHSRFIAMQIKVALLGTPFEVYDRKFPIKKVGGAAANGVSC